MARTKLPAVKMKVLTVGEPNYVLHTGQSGIGGGKSAGIPGGRRRTPNPKYSWPERAGQGARLPGTTKTAGRRSATSWFWGVQKSKSGRWSSTCSVNGSKKMLGTFDTEELAARAYDKMQLWLKLNGQSGRRLRLNFLRNDYDADLPALKEMSWEELVAQMRQEGAPQQIGTENYTSWGKVLSISEGPARLNPTV